MSYNAYPTSNQNYSPYFQQSNGQNGRGQYADHARTGSPYQNTSYQPLSAYQSAQHPASSSASQSSHPGTAHNNYGYGNPQPQDPRAGYSYGRSSVDTSALGNLAYASSLGRNNWDAQQKKSYSGSQNAIGYGQNNSYGTSNGLPSQHSTDHDQIGSSGYRPQAATTSSSQQYQYSSSAGGTYQPHQSDNGGRMPAQGQAYPQGSQQSQSSTPQVPSDPNKQPSRPSSGQALQRKAVSQNMQSPNVPQARVATPQQHADTGSRIGAHTPDTQHKVTSHLKSHPTSKSTDNITTSISTSSRKAVPPPPPAPPDPVSNGRQSSNTNNHDGSRKSQTSTPTSSYPMTVNPSQVFNDVEYQRRQAAAAAEVEARRKAEEARLTPSISTSNVSGDVDLEKKNAMELELQTMMEKMRDYKAKDPSLFSQIWEQVKKGGTSQRNIQQASQGSAISPVVIEDSVPSPINPGSDRLPLESELPAKETFPAGFDRGRFPAQRRRRGGGGATSPPSKMLATPKQTPDSNDLGSDNLRSAMKQYHKDSPLHTVTPPVAQMAESQSVPRLPKQSEPAGPGVTYWPENKKRTLAEAARMALLSEQNNADKTITAEEIHGLLDQNPSYLQMCEILEHRGFKIDRSHFARRLLSAVPDLGSHNSKTPKESSTLVPKPPAEVQLSNGVPTAAHSATRPLPNGLPTYETTRPQKEVIGTQAMSPSMLNGPPTPHARPFPQPSQGYTPSGHLLPVYPNGPITYNRNTYTHPHSESPAGRQSNPAELPYPPPPAGFVSTASSPNHGMKWGPNTVPHYPSASAVSRPPTKQDMARKRSFGDIVDLTQNLSDDEDVEPPQQRRRIEDSTTMVVTEQAQEKKAQANLDKSGPTSAVADLRSSDDGINLDNFEHKPPKNDLLRSPGIARPMNKRQDALRRSSYNPKTLARDVLLAIGRHTKLSPLNSHLDSLRDKFMSVSYDTDLNTIRWDFIDPGGDPPPMRASDVCKEEETSGKSVKHAPDQESPPHVAVVIGSSGTANRKDRLKPTRGGHTTSGTRTLSASSPTPQQSSQPGQESGLSRFVNHHLPVMLNSITGLNGRMASSEANTIAGNSHIQQPSTPASGLVPKRTQSAHSGNLDSSGKRRAGRPPGAKNKVARPDKGVARKSRSILIQDKTILKPVQDTSVKDPEKQSQSRDRSTPVRPSSLRNAITPRDGVAVVIPSPSPSVIEASRASSSFSTKSKPTIASRTHGRSPAAPTYAVFKCQWASCPAELHNLEILRKHVRKHKIFGDGLALCLWNGCHSDNITNAHGPERFSFRTEKAWENHVEEKHISKIG